MPLDINELPDPQDEILVPFEGVGEVNALVNWNALTPHNAAQLTSKDAAERCSALADLVISWDLTDQGVPIPPQAHLLQNVPTWVLDKVVQELVTKQPDLPVAPPLARTSTPAPTQ